MPGGIGFLSVSATRGAFPHGLQQSDAAWGVVYQRQGDELQQAHESLLVAEKEFVAMRAANERLRRELDRALHRANDADWV